MPIAKDATAGAAILESTASGNQAILYQSGGAWVLNLPRNLRAHESEIESLLAHVFAGKQTAENLELAQQMTINWCQSKCRKIGVPFELS